MVELFPFQEYWSFYALFSVFVAIVLLLDLGVFNRKAHVISVKEAAIWSVAFVSMALIFNVLLYLYCLYYFPENPRLMAIPGFDPELAAQRTAIEFLTGLFIEKALAVDNIFVFIVILNFFAVPSQYQHRVLFYGIFGALVFRAIFIAMGSVLMQFKYVVIFFGVLLVYTGFKMIFAKETHVKPEDNWTIRLIRKFIPFHPHIVGNRFFIREGGKLMATPLFVCLIMLELSDIVFALDSVPAIFAITKEPFIVFTSNIFAILGLRAMFFLLIGVIGKLKYLKYGIALILVFVGCKMSWLNALFDGHFPINWSLIIITTLILGAVAASLLFPDKTESSTDH